MNITANDIDFKELNAQIKSSRADVCIDGCYGQRYIGSGLNNKNIIINGTPGNALGAYLNGGTITVNGNAQDAVGDTMNDGTIIIHGNAGDALGYAMRGGKIFVRGNAGYRTGIHMKEYNDKCPAIVIGGRAGSFLGEYIAGGIIVVLGIGEQSVPVCNFTGTGMHGGRIFIRSKQAVTNLPAQVTAAVAAENDLAPIKPLVEEFSGYFNTDAAALLKEKFYILTPNAKNPYKQLYVEN